jgi:pilus assembly protein Flp/PilA
MKNFINMLKDESGASAAEYALILAIVGSGIAIAAIYLGGKIGASLEATGDEIEACTTASSGSSGC